MSVSSKDAYLLHCQWGLAEHLVTLVTFDTLSSLLCDMPSIVDYRGGPGIGNSDSIR